MLKPKGLCLHTRLPLHTDWSRKENQWFFNIYPLVYLHRDYHESLRQASVI